MDPETEIPSNVDVTEIIEMGGLVTGMVILVATWLLVRMVTATVERSAARFVHRRLLLNQFGTLMVFMIYIGGISLAVGTSVNLSKEVILALTGTAAVTIGFALKDLASSVLAGVTIIIDRPFQVGDRVKFDSYYGEITAIGLRSVRIVTPTDQYVTIPNNKFLTEAVASSNHGNLDMMISQEFYVAPDQDIALAKRIVEECMTSCRYVYMGKPWSVLVGQTVLDCGVAVRLLATAHVIDVKYERQFESDVSEKVILAFNARCIALAGTSPPGEAAA